jgi:hypothetical protein
MTYVSKSWATQKAGWSLLKGLRTRAIDLDRVSLIRSQTPEFLRNVANLEPLLPKLGLNDEGLHEFPLALHPHCGTGLLVWQFPCQFAPYLARLATLGVTSYLELGIRHGGSFIATVEVLDRCSPLAYAVAVDILPCVSMPAYIAGNPRVRFECINTQGPEFAAMMIKLDTVDLVFVDSHHEAQHCRREFHTLAAHANMIAFHDISNRGCPGIGEVWREIEASGEWHCESFTRQYDDTGPYMGIGLAIKPSRLTNHCIAQS